MDGIPSQTRQWPFPMPRVSLGAGDTKDSTNTAQLIVRPTRLTISESLSPSATDIVDISVGQRSQFINRGGSVPITMFGPQATDSLVNFDTASVGNTISISYVNNTLGTDATVVSTGLLCVTAAY
jgi:hypothetical protein